MHLYKIPALDGLKQKQAVELINSWDICAISINDWKNCKRKDRSQSLLPYDEIEDTLQKILDFSNDMHNDDVT